MLVIACYDLMRDVQTGNDETIFPVAMCCLVQVHEIHIDGIIRKLLVSLGMQMKQRLAEDLKSLDPHLGR